MVPLLKPLARARRTLHGDILGVWPIARCWCGQGLMLLYKRRKRTRMYGRSRSAE